jgi:hypothetical protein
MMGERYPDGTPKIPSQMCIECGMVLNAASPAAGVEDTTEASMPSPGDVQLCVLCGKLMLFDEHLRPREPTPHEWADPVLIDLQARARTAAARMNFAKHFPPRERSGKA